MRNLLSTVWSNIHRQGILACLTNVHRELVCFCWTPRRPFCGFGSPVVGTCRPWTCDFEPQILTKPCLSKQFARKQSVWQLPVLKIVFCTLFMGFWVLASPVPLEVFWWLLMSSMVGICGCVSDSRKRSCCRKKKHIITGKWLIRQIRWLYVDWDKNGRIHQTEMELLLVTDLKNLVGRRPTSLWGYSRKKTFCSISSNFVAQQINAAVRRSMSYNVWCTFDLHIPSACSMGTQSLWT